MTDRELLELAARAAGLKLSEPHYTDALMVEKVTGQGVGHCTAVVPWNPLTDDGDALRLAVMLRLTVKIEDHEIEVFNWEECLVSDGMFNGDDYEAATRRAIVRAAAEIGRAA